MQVIVKEIYTYTLEVKDKREAENLQSSEDNAEMLLVDKITSGEAKLVKIDRFIS